MIKSIPVVASPLDPSLSEAFPDKGATIISMRGTGNISSPVSCAE